jgi:hypothetical protein
MTTKQMARRFMRNAEIFAACGDQDRAFHCIELAAMLYRKGLINMRGHLYVEYDPQKGATEA